MCFIGVSASFAQQEGFQVPKANQWWKKDVGSQTLIYTKSGQSLQGPKAKNASPMEKKQGELTPVNFNNQNELKGPMAKNRKFWKK